MFCFDFFTIPKNPMLIINPKTLFFLSLFLVFIKKIAHFTTFMAMRVETQDPKNEPGGGLNTLCVDIKETQDMTPG